MATIQNSIYKAAQYLHTLATNPQREARLLMAHALQTSYEDIFFAKDRLLTKEEEILFNAFLQRRLNHEPISKIMERREFWGLSFQVTKDTLDPRPDSETLIEAVLKAYPNKTQRLRILDLGTGTGCLLLSLLHEYPQAYGIGVDRSKAACCVAHNNAKRLNLNSRCSFLVGHWGDALMSVFDIIITNPPYICNHTPLPPEVIKYDPEMALFGGKDGLDSYLDLANQIPRLVKPDSKVFLEIGSGQLQAITPIFSPDFFIQVIPDLNGINRCLVLRQKKNNFL